MKILLQLILKDHIRRLWCTILSIFILIIFSLQGIALATVCETPGKSNAYIFQPYAWDPFFGNFGGYCETVSYHHGYVPQREIENVNPGTTPTLTLQMFRDAMESGNYGIFYVETHGSEYGFAVETYDHTTEGQGKCEAAFDNYVAAGYKKTEIYTAESSSGYHISVMGEAIQSWFNGSDTIIYVNACKSAAFNNSWVARGARDALGYDHDILASFPQGCDKFFERMDGARNRGADNTRRQVDQAAKLRHIKDGSIKSDSKWNSICDSSWSGK